MNGSVIPFRFPRNLVMPLVAIPYGERYIGLAMDAYYQFSMATTLADPIEVDEAEWNFCKLQDINQD